MRKASDDHLPSFFTTSGLAPLQSSAVVPPILKEWPVMRGRPWLDHTELHIFMNSPLSRRFCTFPCLKSQMKLVAGKGDACMCVFIASVALSGGFWSARKTVSPWKSFVFVHGREICDEFSFPFACPDQSALRGRRFGSNSRGEDASSSPSLHWPHHAVRAMASAHFSLVEPCCHSLAKAAIIEEVTGGLGSFLLALCGQNSVKALLIKDMAAGFRQAWPCFKCQALIAAKFCFAAPGPVLPSPSHAHWRMSSSDAGSALLSAVPSELANFIYRCNAEL